jgi:hypothetical protein
MNRKECGRKRSWSNLSNFLTVNEKGHEKISNVRQHIPYHTVKLKLKLKLKLIYDRQSVGQSVLVSGTHLGPLTDFFLSP